MISFALEEEESLLQDTVRRIACDLIRPKLREIENGVPPGLGKTVAELGLPWLCASEADGGLGARLVTQLIALEELAWGDAGSSLALCPSENYVALLSSLGTQSERQRFLRPITDGADGAVGAVAYAAEKPDAVVVTTTTNNAYRLSGEKPFVLHAEMARFFLVFTETEVFVVEAGVGVSVIPGSPLLGLDAARPGKVMFDNAPAIRLEDPALAERLPSALVAATLRQSARQVGLGRAAYEFALEYTQERKAFGKPVAHFQAIAFELADLAIAVDSARWLLWRAADALLRPDAIAPGAQAIVQANEVAFHCADRAVQLLGGAGFIRDFPVEKWLRETKALALCGVPSDWCNEVIASAELGTPIEAPSLWMQPFYS